MLEKGFSHQCDVGLGNMENSFLLRTQPTNEGDLQVKMMQIDDVTVPSARDPSNRDANFGNK